jgi:hypothetical protein
MSKRDAFCGMGAGVVLTLAVSWLMGDPSSGGGAKALLAEQRRDPAALRLVAPVGVPRPDGPADLADAQAPIGPMGPLGCVVVGPPGEVGPAGPDGPGPSNSDISGFSAQPLPNDGGLEEQK